MSCPACGGGATYIGSSDGVRHIYLCRVCLLRYDEQESIGEWREAKDDEALPPGVGPSGAGYTAAMAYHWPQVRARDIPTKERCDEPRSSRFGGLPQ